MKTRINPKQVTIVYSWNLKLQPDYVWTERKEKRVFFGLFKVQDAKEGYFNKSDGFSGFWYNKEYSIDHLFELEPKKGLYRKPEISIVLSCGTGVRKSFNSDAAMEKWIEDNLSGVKLIKM